MSNSMPGPYGDIRHPFGLPMGTVRGFMSVLICAFFWIFLLQNDNAVEATAPLAHFFLLTLVFLAFASHPIPNAASGNEFLPWLMRLLFVGGSIAVLIFVGYSHSDRLTTRLTPAIGEIGQWPVLLATLSGGFGVGLFARYLLRHNANDMFQTIRAWTGVIAILLLIAETVFQFLIRPNISTQSEPQIMQFWEGTIIAFVAAYFGTRA